MNSNYRRYIASCIFTVLALAAVAPTLAWAKDSEKKPETCDQMKERHRLEMDNTPQIRKQRVHEAQEKERKEKGCEVEPNAQKTDLTPKP